MSTITGILGIQGSGKTMIMTYFAKKEAANGRTIYSNYHLKGIDYTPVNTLEDIEKMRNGVFLGDELWLWVFSRTSQSKLNKEINKIVMLNRKRDIDIYYTAQRFKSVDVMLRSVTNYFVYPFLRKINNKWRIGYHIYNELGFYIATYLLKNSLEYYGHFYDTTEEIQLLKNKKESISFEELGKPLEDNFRYAIKKFKNISVIPILHSGNKQDLTYDFLLIDKKCKTFFAIDVKSIISRNRIVNSSSKIGGKIENALNNGCVPCWVFPKKPKINTKNIKNWWVCVLNNLDNENYLKKIRKYPVAGQLIKNDFFSIFP